jgi:hypothetical protein
LTVFHNETELSECVTSRRIGWKDGDGHNANVQTGEKGGHEFETGRIHQDGTGEKSQMSASFRETLKIRFSENLPITCFQSFGKKKRSDLFHPLRKLSIREKLRFPIFS